MSTEDLKDLISKLPELSGQDLAQIRARIEYLQQARKDPVQVSSIPANQERSESMFYRSMQDFLTKKTGQNLPPYPVFLKQGKNVAKFREGIQELDKFISGSFGVIQSTQRKQLYRLFLDLIALDIQSLEFVPLAQRTIVDRIRRVPELVDVYFPGYRVSGHLGKILLQLGVRRDARNKSTPEARVGGR